MATSPLKQLSAQARSIYSRFFAPKVDEETMQFVRVLQNVDLFSPLTRRQLIKLAPAFHRRHYKRDEVIYYKGDPGLGLYVVESGSVSVDFETDAGTSTPPATLTANQVFGVVSTWGDIRRQETARATAQTSVLGLFSPELKSVIRRNPALGAAVLNLLVQHIAELHVAFVDRMSDTTNPEIVVDTLLELEKSGPSASQV